MVILWFLAGAGIEVLNTLTRKWSVERVQGRGAVVWIVGGVVLRMVGTAVLLMLAFRHSAVSGVAGLVGYLICRWVMIWWINHGLDSARSE
jgi:hypothetical protein